MITLDEAIERERKQAEMYKFEYEGECAFYGAKFVDEHSGNFDCIKKMHEHEQLAEWLEALKDYRDKNKMVVRIDIENMDSVKDKIDELSKYAESQYNKAIDDFIEKVELKYLGVHPDELYEKYYPREICKQIKELAEQLKERGANDN